MKRFIHVSICAVFLFFAHTSFACQRPADLEALDGSKTTDEELTAFSKDFSLFVDDMKAYQDCLTEEANVERVGFDKRSRRATEVHENKFADDFNSASDAITQATEDFNESVEDFKAQR